MTVTKAILVRHLFEKMALTQREAKDLVDNFFDEIKRALILGQDVKLSGFGSFTLRTKTARPGRNPKTGQSHMVSARRIVTFRASEHIKRSIEPIARSSTIKRP